MAEPLNTRDLETVDTVIARWQARPGPLLPILHELQETLGYIPAQAVPRVAQALRQTRADVHGVISFYREFRTEPAGKHRVQICCAEACQANGCRQLEAHTRNRLGVDYHQTTRDGQILLEPVFCLGNCSTGPSVRIDDRVLGRVSAERMDQLLDDLTREPLTIQPWMPEGSP